MVKAYTSLETYKIGEYTVSLERLKNTNNGNARYKAYLVRVENDPKTQNTKFLHNAVYMFHGHSMSIYDEAKWIVDYHKKELEA